MATKIGNPSEPTPKKTRKQVAEKIEESRKPKNPPVSQNVDSNTPPSLNTDPKTLVVEETGRAPERTEEQRFEEMSSDQQEEHQLIHLNDPTKAKSDKKKNKNVGNIKDSFDDPDYGEPEKGKFEIKEGDIIDYLFKEVFLASCNWVGDTAGGYIGLGAYQTGSWLYHHPGKAIADSFNVGRKDLGKRIKNIFTSSKTSENEKNSTPDNETGRFATQVLNLHEKQLRINPILANAENIDKIIEAVGQGKVDSIDGLPENLKKMLKKMPPELLSQAANDSERITAIVTDRVNEYMAINTFATNYATAALLDAKAKDKEYGNDNAEALYEMQLLEGKKLFLINLSKPEDERMDPMKMNEMALEARTQASKSIIKDGKYNEVGEKPENNSELISLQQMLGKIPANARAVGLGDVADEQVDNDQRRQRKLDDANRDVSTEQAEQDQNKTDPRRETVKRIKEDDGTRIVAEKPNPKANPSINPKKRGGHE